MQSAQAKDKWLLEYEPEAPRQIEPAAVAPGNDTAAAEDLLARVVAGLEEIVPVHGFTVHGFNGFNGSTVHGFGSTEAIGVAG